SLEASRSGQAAAASGRLPGTCRGHSIARTGLRISPQSDVRTAICTLFDACHPLVVVHGAPACPPDAADTADADEHQDGAARVASVEVITKHTAVDCNDCPEQELDELTHTFSPGLAKRM